MKKYLIIITALVLFGCKKDETVNPNDTNNQVEIFYGKNRFTVTVDGLEREYYAHIPASYDGSINVPMVIMLHGTSGNGLKFYNISGWKEVGEAKNIITVFPSAWDVCFKRLDGSTKNNTKWNSQPNSNWSYCAGETPKDDTKFLESIIEEMSLNYTIDTKKVYLVGFSNGGEMATMCSITMSDKFAAIVTNGSSFKADTTYIPKRKLPVMFQKGANDYGPRNTGPARPLDSLDDYILTNGHLFNLATNTHTNSFDLDTSFTFTVDSNISTANFSNQFLIVMVKGLAHSYPNGKNHPMVAAEVHWEWLKQFSLP